MAVQIPYALTSSLLLRPRLRVEWTPTWVVDVGQVRDGFRRCAVSSEDYLVSSLSLPPDSEEAVKTRKKKAFCIRSTGKADSVVALFKEYSFSDTQMAQIFLVNPDLLTRNPEKVLRPKLEFLFRVGMPISSVTDVVTSNPYVLKRSLGKVIAPCFDLLCSLFANDHRALASFLLKRRPSRIFLYFSVTNTRANVETLRALGVPDPNIIKMAHVPVTLALEPLFFTSNAMKIKEMGFDPQRVGFVNGLRVLNAMSEDKWAAKAEVIKRCFGWTDDHQVVALFRKNYYIMTSSEEKLKRSFDILVNRVGLTPDEISKYTGILNCNFDTRILPRFSVLQVLRSKGIIDNLCMARAFMVSEDDFLGLYVKKYQSEFPQLMELYTKNKELKIED